MQTDINQYILTNILNVYQLISANIIKDIFLNHEKSYANIK